MDGVGWCIHDESGEAVSYPLVGGLPPWSREFKSRSTPGGGAGGTQLTSESLVPPGGGSVDDPPLGSGASPLSGDTAEVAGGAGTQGAEPGPCPMLVHGDTAQVGGATSPAVHDGSVTMLMEQSVRSTSEAGSDASSDTDAPPEVGPSAEPSQSGIVLLADLSPRELAGHLAGLALAHAEPPPCSPRLRAVLEDYGVRASECAPGYPDTIAKAAFCIDDDCFGNKSIRVTNACLGRWTTISSSEARARAVPVSQIVAERCVHKDRSLAGRALSFTAEVTESSKVVDGGWCLVEVAAVCDRRRLVPRSQALGHLWKRSELTTSAEIEANERYIAGAQLLAVIPSFLHHSLVDLSEGEIRCLSEERLAGLLRAHFGAFSPGSISGARRSLSRLLEWLAANQMVRSFNPSS